MIKNVNMTKLLPAVTLTMALAIGGTIFFTQPGPLASDRATSDLEDYPGFRFIESHLDEDAFSNEEQAREYLTAECMAAQGWKYLPAPSAQAPVRDINNAPEFEDPNAKYVHSLSDAERTAYYLALSGVEDPHDEVNGYNPDNGCMNESLREIPGVYALASKFLEDIVQLENQVDAGAAIAEATSILDSCMSAHQTSCHPAYLETRRIALIEAQNQFVEEHESTFDAFKASHGQETKRVAEIIKLMP